MTSLILKTEIKLNLHKPHGKESTEVRISQNKGKESKNSYQKLKKSLKDRHTKTVSRYFDRHRLIKMAVPVEISRYSFRVPVLQ